MRTTISKDQIQELKQALSKLRVDSSTIDDLLTSWNSANTYKAYRQGKKIITDDNWTIHFGAKWATPPETNDSSTSEADDNDTDITDFNDRQKLATPEEVDNVITRAPQQKQSPEVHTEDIASRTFKSIVSLIKKPAEKKIEPESKPEAPSMKRVIIEIDSEMLTQMKSLAEAEKIPVSSLIRLAIRKYLN